MALRSILPLFLSGATLTAAPLLAAPAQETYRIQASDGAPSDFFAFDLAVEGSFAIAGAHNHDTGQDQGAAYVFDWATGTELFKWVPSAPSPGMGFGWDVAIAGSKVVAGAPFDDGVTFNTGSAYVLDLSTGTETAILTASDASVGADFGNAVDADGSIALVGAPGDAGRTGAGYLFDLNTGNEIMKLVPINAGPGGADGYGYRVAIDGSYGIIADASDSVAVFDFATGTELYKLTRPGSFGRSLDAKDGLLVVGAIGDSDQGPSAGAAYVFDLATGAELAKLLAYDAAPFDNLGVGVAISSSHIVAGAFSSDISGDRSGSAYVYDRATFDQVARLVPSDGQASNRFGRTVAIDGTEIFASAVGFGGLRGSAYRFDTDALDPGSPSCFGQSCACGTNDPFAGCPNATGSGAFLGGSGSASIAMDNLTLTTSMLPANQFGIYFMGNKHVAATPLGNGLLCAAGALFRFPVQNTGVGIAELGPGIAASTCATFPGGGCIAAGSSWTFQFWYRDGGSSCPASSNSSSAWTVLFTP